MFRYLVEYYPKWSDVLEEADKYYISEETKYRINIFADHVEEGGEPALAGVIRKTIEDKFVGPSSITAGSGYINISGVSLPIWYT